MNANSVAARVVEELGDRRETKNGWSFGDLLTDPPIQSTYQETDGTTSVYWVILIEGKDGYHVVFDESENDFGLATSGTVIGWYGSLIDTIEGM